MMETRIPISYEWLKTQTGEGYLELFALLEKQGYSLELREMQPDLNYVTAVPPSSWRCWLKRVPFVSQMLTRLLRK